MLDADVVILGGGCAGLSLATALAEQAPKLRVITLESRELYSRDRTWCFWDTDGHPFQDAVTHRWQSWRVRHRGVEARQQSGRYSYQHLPADRFYELTIQRMLRAGQQLCMKAEVVAAYEQDDACRVETNQGSLRSRWIFDSRPRKTKLQTTLEQRFTGWHVRTELPCFDPSVVDLMDFATIADAGRIAFFYVLPFSTTEALVEATLFDRPSLSPADAESMLRDYMRERRAGAYQVLYREAAVLSMGGRAACAWQQSRIVEIGTRGGRVKASSGYAFQRIQRQSSALASALATHSPLPRTFERRFYSVLDRIFLSALRYQPERAAGYFMAMFGSLPPDTLVRFLSETASPHEVLRVMLALPKLDFLRAAILPSTGERAR